MCRQRPLRLMNGPTCCSAERPVSDQLPAVRAGSHFAAATSACGRLPPDAMLHPLTAPPRVAVGQARKSATPVEWPLMVDHPRVNVGFQGTRPARSTPHQLYAFGSMAQSGRTVPSYVIPRATNILSDGQISVCSEISKASSTSMPRYWTVLSSLL